jgi:hypothetical protein
VLCSTIKSFQAVLELCNKDLELRISAWPPFGNFGSRDDPEASVVSRSFEGAKDDQSHQSTLVDRALPFPAGRLTANAVDVVGAPSECCCYKLSYLGSEYH